MKIYRFASNLDDKHRNMSKAREMADINNRLGFKGSGMEYHK